MRGKKAIWRNIVAAAIFTGAWVCLYLIPATLGSISVSPTIRFFLIPIAIGIGISLALGGTWADKFLYVVATPAIPVLFFGVSFSAGTGPEGSAFAWMLAAMPLLPYLIAAGATIGLIEFTKRDGAQKQ